MNSSPGGINPYTCLLSYLYSIELIILGEKLPDLGRCKECTEGGVVILFYCLLVEAGAELIHEGVHIHLGRNDNWKKGQEFSQSCIGWTVVACEV